MVRRTEHRPHLPGWNQRWDFAVSTGGESAYLSVPKGDPADASADGGEGLYSRVVRLDIGADGALSHPVTILEVPSTGIHNAGSAAFGPDGALYVNIGDNHDFGESQNLASPFGKILRIDADGHAAAGNPFAEVAGADPRVWASGIRNTSAFTWLEDGTMVGADNGDTGDDEINVLVAGANYGWPPAAALRPGERAAQFVFHDTIAPAGIAPAPHYPGWPDSGVLVCGFVSRKMLLVDMADASAAPVPIVDGCSLRVLRAPDGSVVFSDEHAIWHITGG